MRKNTRKGRVLNGWLVMHKPVGLTSAQAVAQVKQITRAAKVGHGGTLDPFSEGLLPMALGEATKMLSLVLEGDKAYTCWIRFGSETDTGDPTGQVVEKTEFIPERSALEAALHHFTGPQQQVPPAYSAIHVGGVRAYELARRGEEVVLPPRSVVIHTLTLEAYEAGLATLHVVCSKGAYMRSLARDIGRYTGSFGHLERLLRTRTLGFSLEESVTLEQLTTVVAQGQLEKIMLSVDRVLDDIPALRLRVEERHKVLNGHTIRVDADRLLWYEADEQDAMTHPSLESTMAGAPVERTVGMRDGNRKPSAWGERVRLISPENHFFGIGLLTAQPDDQDSWLCQPKRLFRL